MKKNLTILIAIFIITLAAGAIVAFIPANKAVAPTTHKAGITDLITADTPLIDAEISSPLAISGQARGTWYFEASFPVELKDANGTIIAQAPAQAQSDWMTENFVPFALSLPYPTQPTGSKGTLVLKKDNPSGDPAKDQSISIPVTFK